METKVKRDFPELIEINVGGRIYTTTKTTLTTAPSMLSKMFSGEFKTGLVDSSGRPFIDRNPRAFFYVLEFLRTGQRIDTLKCDGTKEEVNNEFIYFGINAPADVEESAATPKKKRQKTVNDDTIRDQIFYPQLIKCLKKTCIVDYEQTYVFSLGCFGSRTMMECNVTRIDGVIGYDFDIILNSVSTNSEREKFQSVLKEDIECRDVKVMKKGHKLVKIVITV